MKDIDRRFFEYLKGKSVAIVGRSNSLRFEKQAELIESYDIVARLHQGQPYLGTESHPGWDTRNYFVPDNLHKMVGTRTNIFMGSMYQITDVDYAKRILNVFKKAGGEFITNELPYNAKDGFLSPEVEQLVGEVHNWSQAEQESLEEEIGDFPLVGTSAIMDIVSRDVGDVYVTGFPCFMDYLDLGIRPETLRDQVTEKVCVNNLRYLCSVARRKNIKVDKTMKDLFYKYC